MWNALPGEKVRIELTKRKNKLAEGLAVEIIEPSKYRTEPKDEAYLSTSPWQIMDFATENTQKQAILQETMQREHVDYDQQISMIAGKEQWHYRNKMEYSFWADDNGLHLALFNRGSRGKRSIPGSSIAMPSVDKTANDILAVLSKNGIRGSQLKTVVVRSNQKGDTVAALFVKDESFPEIKDLSGICNGVVVYYSTHKSPASVITKKLYQYGDLSLTDTIGTSEITYDVNSFFQVNLDIFEKALQQMSTEIDGHSFVDMYSGVGTIGLGIGGPAVLVESDKHNNEMARQNAAGSPAKIIEATAETATQHISSDDYLIVDPPRAGLHAKVTDAILEIKPPKIIYLSCNPITQARDIALLQDTYKIVSITGYNFFPRTPHIESLAILELN